MSIEEWIRQNWLRLEAEAGMRFEWVHLYGGVVLGPPGAVEAGTTKNIYSAAYGEYWTRPLCVEEIAQLNVPGYRGRNHVFRHEFTAHDLARMEAKRVTG